MSMKKPELHRQLTVSKYENSNSNNTKIKDNCYLDDNNIYFEWIGSSYHSEELNKTLNSNLIIKYYSINLDNKNFSVAFRMNTNQENPKIKIVSNKEYVLFDEIEYEENNYIISKKKQEVIDNSKITYFIIEFRYEKNTIKPTCNIQLLFSY